MKPAITHNEAAFKTVPACTRRAVRCHALPSGLRPSPWVEVAKIEHPGMKLDWERCAIDSIVHRHSSEEGRRQGRVPRLLVPFAVGVAGSPAQMGVMTGVAAPMISEALS